EPLIRQLAHDLSDQPTCATEYHGILEVIQAIVRADADHRVYVEEVGCWDMGFLLHRHTPFQGLSRGGDARQAEVEPTPNGARRLCPPRAAPLRLGSPATQSGADSSRDLRWSLLAADHIDIMGQADGEATPLGPARHRMKQLGELSFTLHEPQIKLGNP